MKIILLMTAAAVSSIMVGCAVTPTPPPISTFDLDTDADSAWAAAVEAAEAMDLLIARSDGESRTIVTDWQTYRAFEKYGGCLGVLPDARLEMRHTIRVSPADSGATLAFDSRFRMIRNTGAGPLTDCPSTGAFEQRFTERTKRALR